MGGWVGFEVGGRGFCCDLAGAIWYGLGGRSFFTSGDEIWKHKVYVEFVGWQVERRDEILQKKKAKSIQE